MTLLFGLQSISLVRPKAVGLPEPFLLHLLHSGRHQEAGAEDSPAAAEAADGSHTKELSSFQRLVREFESQSLLGILCKSAMNWIDS